MTNARNILGSMQVSLYQLSITTQNYYDLFLSFSKSYSYSNALTVEVYG